MSLTLPIEAIADSTRWVIWVSISVGTAPGWETITLAAGKLTSGIWLMSMFMNPATPSTVSMKNSTIGGIGLRIAQADMLCIFDPSPQSPSRHGENAQSGYIA